MSIKQLIIQFIEDNGPKFGGQIEDHIRSIMGAKASNASRRCRELVEDGVLERELCQIEGVGNKVVKYKIKKVDALSGIPSYRPEVLKQRIFEQSQKSLI